MKIFYCKKVHEQFSKNRVMILGNFINYCDRALEIDSDYSIYFVDDRKKYGIKTTAVCRHKLKTIFVYITGRAFSDVLRSIAHELAHVSQHKEGILTHHNYVHFHSEAEDDANIASATLLNAYAEVVGLDAIYDN